MLCKLQESVGGCSSPSPRPWAHRCRTINVCGAWRVRRQNYGYFPSCMASPPIGWYQIIQLGDTETCIGEPKNRRFHQIWRPLSPVQKSFSVPDADSCGLILKDSSVTTEEKRSPVERSAEQPCWPICSLYAPLSAPVLRDTFPQKDIHSPIMSFSALGTGCVHLSCSA